MEAPKPQVVGSTRESVTLTWDPVAVEDGSNRPHYTVQIKHPLNGWVNVYRGYKTQQEIKGLAAGECHYFRLKVITAQGESSWSLTTPAATKDPPVAIVNLHRAVQHNRPQDVRKILNSRHGIVDVLNHGGTSPLIQAAVKGDPKLVGLLLSAGANVNLRADSTGRTALMLACYNGHVEVVKQLREKGARWDVIDRVGCTALHYAVDGSHIEAVLHAVQDGADVEARDSHKWTPLMRGIILETPAPVLQVLIQHGADVNAADGRRLTCLMQAVLSGIVDTVKLLVDSGVDLSPCNDYRNTAVDMAREREKKDILRLLTPANIEDNKEDNSKRSSLRDQW